MNARIHLSLEKEPVSIGVEATVGAESTRAALPSGGMG